MVHCNSCSCCLTDDVCHLHPTLPSCSNTKQKQHSNKKRKQRQEEETQQQTKNVVVGTNWDVCDYDIPLKKEKSDPGNGIIWGYCEYDLPMKKRKINREKSNLSYNNNNNNNNVSFIFSSIENNVSSSTSHDDTKIANKQETKKTCNVDDEWEIKKVLEKSDVCRTLSRLMLKKELTQEFVIPMGLCGAKAAKHKGVEVKVWDVDTKSLHSLVFKIWTSAQCHIFNKRWFKDFVLRRELKKGDQIGLHWDQDNGRFNFSVITL
ncbi:putative B3 domain-containing protein At1g78640 isoform X1 [Trifolium pratense]|uniref:putative B3 domain-containing protein At1g78640 isoform X1 n=1 Tax=Trifolium pratense TaxID=57577 RepID=UPI001E6930DA|nr:putative B3 domain-containing protein At1g78640 isoform X1 [Trifolium pratense]